MTTLNAKRVCLMLMAVGLLTACGFQLRGVNQAIDHAYSTMKVVDLSGDEAFLQVVEQALEGSGVEILEASENVLEIQSSIPGRRTASYSSRGKSAEFELVKDVKYLFRREDKILIEPTTVSSRRSYLYRETAAVGKAEEEVLLRQEMDQDLAHRIMLSLQRSARDSSAPAESATDAGPDAEASGETTEP